MRSKQHSIRNCNLSQLELHVQAVPYVPQDTKRQKKTLKKTRKFIVDGVEVSVTTSKIITDNDTKNEEMRFLRYSPAFVRLNADVMLMHQPGNAPNAEFFT